MCTHTHTHTRARSLRTYKHAVHMLTRPTSRSRPNTSTHAYVKYPSSISHICMRIYIHEHVHTHTHACTCNVVRASVEFFKSCSERLGNSSATYVRTYVRTYVWRIWPWPAATRTLQLICKLELVYHACAWWCMVVKVRQLIRSIVADDPLQINCNVACPWRRQADKARKS